MPQVQGPRYVGHVVFERVDAERLRHLVDAWIEADRDWRKLSDWRKVFLLREDKSLLDQQMKKAMHARFALDENGRLITWIDDTSIRPFDVGVAFFLRIAADDENWRLRAPCPNCRKYFLQKTHRFKKYCPRCRRSESGPRMKVAREKKHKMLVSMAREVSAKCPRGCKDWKAWMVERINRRIIPMRFDPVTRSSLTRWVRNGELLLPKAPAVN